MKQWFDNHGGVKVETPACARTGDKATEKYLSNGMGVCPFLLPLTHQKVWSP